MRESRHHKLFPSHISATVTDTNPLNSTLSYSTAVQPPAPLMP